MVAANPALLAVLKRAGPQIKRDYRAQLRACVDAKKLSPLNCLRFGASVQTSDRNRAQDQRAKFQLLSRIVVRLNWQSPA